MDSKNRLSSKINYEALDKLNEELGYAPAFLEVTKSNCGSLCDMQLSNEKNSRDDEFEHESNGYGEEVEARQAKMTIHMLQMTNIMDTITMMNAIMIWNAILKN